MTNSFGDDAMIEKSVFTTKDFRIYFIESEYFLDTFTNISPTEVEEALSSIYTHINPMKSNISNACNYAPRKGIKIADKMQEIQIVVSEDQLEAYLLVNCSNEELQQNKSNIVRQIKDEMTNQELVFGVLTDALSYMRGYTSIVLARGMEPIHGDDSIISVPDVMTVTFEEKDDTVDYYNLNLIHTYKKGDYIGERINPTLGTPGKTVTGKPIHPKPGELIPLRYDATTMIEIDEGIKSVLRAQKSGALHLLEDGETLTIFECLEIDNVDFSTGNIDTESFVIIQNTIEDGFSVRSTKGIEIRGNIGIGKVKIECDGDVLVKGGIAGKEEGYIRAKGTVYSKFANHATIESENVVDIGGDCIDANISAAKVIVGSLAKGEINGGNIEAIYSIQCKSCGNEYDKETTLTVFGFDRAQVEEAKTLAFSQLQELRAESSRMKKILDSMQSSHRSRQLSQEIYEVRQAFDELNDCVRDTEKIVRFYVEVLKTKGDGEISISEKIYPNTYLKIRNQSLKVSKLRFGGKFFLSEGTLKETQ